MAERILICVSAAQVVVAHWRGRKIDYCQTYPNDEGGVAQFAEYLGSIRSALVSFAIDTVEEDYRFDTLPHASGSDRASLLDRKLKQHYRNTPYATAVPLGRDKGKRRDDQYLFCAMTNPGLIDPWLRAVATSGLPVTGIHPVPMLTGALIEKLKVNAPNVMVVAAHSSGLRLTIHRQGQFRLSRLTRGNPSTGDNPGKLIAEEISNTRMYFASLQPEAMDEKLTVIILDRHDQLEAMATKITAENSLLDCVHVGRSMLASQLGVDTAHLDVAFETIYLPIVAEKPPECNLARVTVTAGYQTYRKKRLVYGLAAAVALLGVVWGGYNLWYASDLENQAAEAAKQSAVSQAQYRELTRQFPPAPTTSDDLVKTVEVYQRLVKNGRSPALLMDILAKAMESLPEIFIQELGWAYGTGQIEATGSAPAAPPAAEQPPSTDPAGQRRQSGYVAGEVRPFHGDYRAAIETINRLASELARDPAVASVQVVKLPLNVNPGLGLSGNTRDAAEHTGAAEFRLALVMKPGT